MDNSIGVLGTTDERSKYDIRIRENFNCGVGYIEKFAIKPTAICPPPPKCPPCVCPKCPAK